MNFFSKLLGGLFGGGQQQQAPVQKLANPDLSSYWKQYTGWISNINDKAAGKMADVRARMSAAGASPDSLMQATEHLESQRKSDIAALEGGPTYGFLKEGFDIASGTKANPYVNALPGAKSNTVYASADEAPLGGLVAGQMPSANAFPKDLTSYYTQFFGAGQGPTADTPEAKAAANAKMAAGGSAKGVVAGGGSASDAAVSSAFVKKETFWG